jgi:hypothetical protein
MIRIEMRDTRFITIVWWAASLCTLCKYCVEDSGVSRAEGSVEGVMGTMVTSMAMKLKGGEGVRGGGGEGRRPTLVGHLS